MFVKISSVKDSAKFCYGKIVGARQLLKSIGAISFSDIPKLDGQKIYEYEKHSTLLFIVKKPFVESIVSSVCI